MAYDIKTKVTQLPAVSATAKLQSSLTVGTKYDETEEGDISFKYDLTRFADLTADTVAKRDSASYASPIIVSSGIEDEETVEVQVRTDDEDNFSVQNVSVTLTYTDAGGTAHTITHKTDAKGYAYFQANKRNTYTLTAESFTNYLQSRVHLFTPSEVSDNIFIITYHLQTANDTAVNIVGQVVGGSKTVTNLSGLAHFAYCPLNTDMQSGTFSATGTASYTLNQGKDYAIGFQTLADYVRPENVPVTADAASKTVYAKYSSKNDFVVVVNVPETDKGLTQNFGCYVYATSSAPAIIDWGDGSAQETRTANGQVTHIYQPGVYMLSVQGGDATSTRVNATYAVNVSYVTQWKSLGTTPTSYASAFTGCTAMTSDMPTFGETVTNVDACFDGCTNAVGTIKKWGTAITSASATFRNCTNLTRLWLNDWVKNTQYALDALVVVPIETDGVTYRYCYKCATAHKSAASWTEAEAANWTLNDTEIMPTTITSYANCVTGCCDYIRSCFYTTWGGTKPVS